MKCVHKQVSDVKNVFVNNLVLHAMGTIVDVRFLFLCDNLVLKAVGTILSMSVCCLLCSLGYGNSRKSSSHTREVYTHTIENMLTSLSCVYKLTIFM